MKHTPSLLSLLLSYDPETGKLHWLQRPRVFFKTDKEHRRWNTRYAGNEAFSVKASGYLEGMVFRTPYKAHRIAWALAHGSWPEGFIDHINGDRADNRLVNLRVVDRGGNNRNAKLSATNTSGVMGVAAYRKRWKAYIRDGGQVRHLGVFDTIEEAAAARRAAEAELGYHPNHGRDA